MPKIVKKKEDTIYRNAKLKDKPYKIVDGDGLYLLVRPTGSKVWQMLYTYGGKNKTYTFGPYPEVSTKHVRTKLVEVKALLREGIDPNSVKQARRMENMGQSDTTFEAVATEWLDQQIWKPKHKKNVKGRFKEDVFTKIGHMQIDKIMPKDMLAVLKSIEARGALDVAKRTNQHCEAVFDYAIVQGLCEVNPAHGRAKLIKTYKPQHRPHLTESQLPEFLNKLDCYSGSRLVQLAMKMLILTWVRPGELRFARWEEIDVDNALWRIPKERMKMGREHLVPLSRQVLEIIEELRPISGHTELLFPGWRNSVTPISDVTLTKVLRIMGYTKENDKHVVPHGMRGTASTIANEHGKHEDAIERQLAHVEKNRVRAAYHHAEYISTRREILQWYADHLDNLKASYDESLSDNVR